MGVLLENGEHLLLLLGMLGILGLKDSELKMEPVSGMREGSDQVKV